MQFDFLNDDASQSTSQPVSDSSAELNEIPQITEVLGNKYIVILSAAKDL